MYDMTIVLLKNETVKCSGDVVHVFMSSFSETADAENTASVTHFCVCVCVCVIKTTRLCHSHIQRQAEHAEFIFK